MKFERIRLKDSCEKIGSGATPRGGKESYKGGDIALIRSQNVHNDRFSPDGLVYIDDSQAAQLANVEVKTGDVLLNITGDSVARCCQVIENILPARVNQHVAIIRPDPAELDARYLRYSLVSRSMQSHLLALASSGATRNALTKGMIESLEIEAPSLADQKHIADILSSLDDKIELNRRMNKTLEAMAQAIFKSWFVDFDPVKAKAKAKAAGLSAEAIERAAMAAIAGKTEAELDQLPESQQQSLAQTAALFPDSFQNSELGEIPQGWSTGSILEEIQLLSGGTPKTAEPTYWDGDILWASAKDVSQCGDAFLIETERKITDLGLAKSAAKLIPKFATVVVARGATTGRLAMFGGIIAMNQTCYAMHSKKQKHFYSFCHSKHFIESLVSAGHGSVFNTITTKTFDASRVVLANPLMISRFEELVSPKFMMILQNLGESRILAQLRDTLLPKLLKEKSSATEQQTAAL